jgi:hypothetical protein
MNPERTSGLQSEEPKRGARDWHNPNSSTDPVIIQDISSSSSSKKKSIGVSLAHQKVFLGK